MEEHKGKSMSLNICCFGVNNIGVPVAAVFAHKCPFLNVAVVDLNPDKVTSWNTKQINMREQGLEEILRKCQNRNLVFTADIKKTVRLADIVFLCLDTTPSHKAKEGGKISDLTETELAVRLIAEVSESNKIVVLKSMVPVGTGEYMKRILSANKQNNVEFQILSIPVFISSGSAVPDLMKPDRILIGSDLTPESLEAVDTMVGIYSQWVPQERIITMSQWSAEISKLIQNAFLAQRLSSLNAMSLISEEFGGDISQIADFIGEATNVGRKYLEPSFGFGGPHLKNDLKSLIFMCEQMSLKESAEYWKEVLLLNDCQKKKFTKKITSAYFNTLSSEKVAVWGVAYKKNSEILDDSLGIELCLNLLAEGARVNIYDTIEKKQVMEELNAAALKSGFQTSLLKDVTCCNDPYKTTYKADAIVVCNELREFKDIDFNLIYKDMIKPPYIFDGRKCLPHEELIKIGFIVKTIGKRFDKDST